MGFKLGDIIHHARLAARPTDPEPPAPAYTVAPESPVLTDGADEDAPDPDAERRD